jgi:hypothetical protein
VVSRDAVRSGQQAGFRGVGPVHPQEGRHQCLCHSVLPKFADIIAVSGNPAGDVTEMERVKFVMKGGQVYRNDLKSLTASASQK